MSNITHNTCSIVPFILSGIFHHFLGTTLEERVSLASVVFTMIVYSYKVYAELSNRLCFLRICNDAGWCHLSNGRDASVLDKRARLPQRQGHRRGVFCDYYFQSSPRTPCLSIWTTLLLTPIDTTNPIISTLYDFYQVSFAASFMFSIMSLWLRAVGIRPVNALCRTPGNFRDGASFVACVLHWSGAVFLVAYIKPTMSLFGKIGRWFRSMVGNL